MIAFAMDERIKEINRLMARTGLKQADLIRETGINRGTMSNIIRGATDNPHDREAIQKILDAINRLHPELSGLRLAKRGMIVIPVYPAISAGEPAFQLADIEEISIPEPDDDLERWGMVVTGESMSPVFAPGDIAVMKAYRPPSGYVVQASLDGDQVIKCLREIGGELELHSYNPDYMPLRGDGWEIQGMCVGYLREYGRGLWNWMNATNGFTWSNREGIR